MDNSDFKNLWLADPRIKHLCRRIIQFATVDFTPLRIRDRNRSNQKVIPANRTVMRSALLIHYCGDVATCVRYVGGLLIGYPYRDHRVILPRIKNIVDDETNSDIARILILGCPASINAHFSRTQVEAYRRYGNHKTIQSNPGLMEKAMTKEDARDNIYTVYQDLAIFVPHINYTPQGLLVKPGKKDRLINDSSFQLDRVSIPYNAFTNKRLEPRITFGPAFTTLLTDIYNYPISFPSNEIYLASDDITGAFRLLKFNLSVVSSKAIQFGDNLHFAVAQTFGDTTSPPNWDPFSRATCQVARHLLSTPDSIPPQDHYMSHVSISDPLALKPIQFTQVIHDRFNPGKIDQNGCTLPPNYAMHIDDKIYADISQERILLAVRAAITANDLVLGTQDALVKPDATDFDKLIAEPISFKRILLGKEINTRTLMVSLPICATNA